MFKVNNKGDVVLVSLLLTWNISHVILVFLLLDSDRWIQTRLFLSDVFDPKLLRLNFRARGEYVTTQFWWKTADFWSRLFALVDPKKWSANSKSGKALRWKWLIDPKISLAWKRRMCQHTKGGDIGDNNWWPLFAASAGSLG